ncbi:MAG: class I SAM-dependent methyltransferase [Caldilineaceae bacterium]
MKAPATTQKLRGGYYTPESIANFLAQWAIHPGTTSVLEPSCGDGNILAAAVNVIQQLGLQEIEILGIEIDDIEAQKTITRLTQLTSSSAVQIHNGDFFTCAQERLLWQHQYDAIIGNPPFIRYQNFQEEHRAIAFSIMQHAGLHPTRLTNAWVPFLVTSTLLLKRGGRIAMVIPAELLQVNYAAELRRFLTDYYSKITLFTFKKLVFADIQQEVVLFLGERDGNEHTGIRAIELHDIAELRQYQHTHFPVNGLKAMDHSTEKWTQYFLEQPEIDILRRLRSDDRVMRANNVIDVDVGMVTGLNEFFILTEQQAQEAGLTAYTKPIVTRSGHLQGIKFTVDDFTTNLAKQFPALILTAPNLPFEELPENVKKYIAYGEQQKFHIGYKCRIRERWYIVPSLWTPDAFMLRQVHHYPKLILNQTEATSTDTIHRVRFVSTLPRKMITAAFLNSLTFAFAEVMGRSYGGGVLELEPNEAEALPIPLNNAEALDFELIHTLVAQGKIEAVLDITDQVLLIDGLGLTRCEVTSLRTAWCKLRDRRVNRKHQKVTNGT